MVAKALATCAEGMRSDYSVSKPVTLFVNPMSKLRTNTNPLSHIFQSRKPYVIVEKAIIIVMKNHTSPSHRFV